VFKHSGLSSIKPVFRDWYRAVRSSTDGSFMKMIWLECDADDSLHVSSYFNISGKCDCLDSTVVMYLQCIIQRLFNYTEGLRVK